MNLTLYVWRQKDAKDKGGFEKYTDECKDISEHMSFLELLDVVNERLITKGKLPIAFDSDCREGICGTCSMVINGRPHGPWKSTTACQLHMRAFKDGDVIYIEPWRASRSPCFKTSWLTGRLSIALCKRVATSARTAVPLQTPTPFRSAKRFPMLPWMLRRASDAALAWLRVQMLRRCSRT